MISGVKILFRHIVSQLWHTNGYIGFAKDWDSKIGMQIANDYLMYIPE